MPSVAGRSGVNEGGQVQAEGPEHAKRESARPAIAGLMVAFAVASAALLPLNGFARFDHAQSLGVTAALFVALVAMLTGGRRLRATGSGLTVLVGASVLAGWALLAAWGAGHARAFDAALPFAIVAMAAAVAGLADDESLWSWSGGAVLYVTAVACVSSALQFVGVEFPARIPYVTDVVAGRGVFDTPLVAAAWFALSGAFFVGWANAPRWLVGAGVAISAAGLAISFEPWAAAAAIAGGLVGGVLRSDLRIRAVGWSIAAAAALVVGLAAGGAAEVSEVDRLPLRMGTPGVSANAPGSWGVDGHAGAAADAALRYAGDAGLLGHGPGAYEGLWEGYVDRDSAFALSHTEGVPNVEHAPVPVLEIAGDFGIPFALVLVVLLGGALVAGVRRGGAGVSVGLATVLGLLIVSPGFHASTVAVLIGLLIGLAVRPSTDAAGEQADGRPALAFATVIAAVAGGHVVKTALWSIPFAASLVFLGHARHDAAREHASAAAAAQARFASEMNAGVLAYVRSEPLLDEAQAHYERAVQLRPNDVDARLALADLYIRRAFGAEDREARVARAERMFERVVSLDPNHRDATLRRANAAMAEHDVPTAVRVLEAYADRGVHRSSRVAALHRLAEIHADVSDPGAAESAYRRAADMLEPGPSRDALLAEAERMKEWAETGSRPREDLHDH
jgi:cytochrome c-type biogenesis protein CcmH/NrfG